MQGDFLLPVDGLLHGQGVRCTAGSLKRLFARRAAAGSITVPDATAGDPSVSSRSAALGDRLAPGESRWYFVHYRDAAVRDCAADRTINATQIRQVTWAP